MPATRHPSDPDRPSSSPDPVLVAEQRHLAEARDALRRMRERTERLEAHGGNAVSTEYLKAALWHRAQSLVDDPTTPLFFGRIDYVRPAEQFYVGRRHVQDADGEPLVIDWRADIARPFYRASAGDPLGLGLRRRFGFQQGRLTAYEDEPLTASPAGRGVGTAPSRILVDEIERPREGPMRDIVSTIQPEQDVLVRAGLEQTICVQGAPGTGKTAVGLHRAAYLLYAHRDRLQRSGVLVVGPNASFLRYIGDVLPALGEVDAAQTTVDDLLAHVPVRAVDPPAVGVVKGDARMAEVLHRAVWSRLRPPVEPMVLDRGTRHWRVGLIDLDEAVDGIRRRGVRYAAGRAMLAQRLAHAVLVRMERAGESPDDRVQDAVARSRTVKTAVEALWPALDPVKIVFGLLSDPAVLAAAAGDLLTEAEQAALVWQPAPRSVARAPWSAADAALVDEVRDLLERTPSVGHVVVDEAQDLSPMQLRAVGRRCSTGSATLLGDLAQGTTPWAARSWARSLQHLGKPDGVVEELTVGFRVPADVLAYASRLLPVIAPDLAPPTSLRAAGGGLEVLAVARLGPGVAAAASAASARPGSVGVVVPDALVDEVAAALVAHGVPFVALGDEHDVDAHLELVPASQAKGLEFDHVVVAEPTAVVAGETSERTGLRRLYVCLTRAVSTLVVVHAAPLPSLLA